LHRDIQRVLFTEEQIVAGIDRLAKQVTQVYRGRELTVVCVLKGSCIFASDLIRRIPIPLELAFVAASSYRSGTDSSELRVSFFPTGNEIEDRDVLLVDDILDTGRTMSRLKRELLERGAGAVSSCVFLDKPARRSVAFDADFKVFDVEDLFVVGYGLDFAGRYRNLPYVAALRKEVHSAVET